MNTKRCMRIGSSMQLQVHVHLPRPILGQENWARRRQKLLLPQSNRTCSNWAHAERGSLSCHMAAHPQCNHMVDIICRPLAEDTELTYVSCTKEEW